MTAGLPGTGIGGLFYLISALLMPIREAWRLATGRSRAEGRRLALRQAAMAAAILSVAWLTSVTLAVTHVVGNSAREANIVLITVLTLGGVLAAVEVVSVALRLGTWILERLPGQATGPPAAVSRRGGVEAPVSGGDQ